MGLRRQVEDDVRDPIGEHRAHHARVTQIGADFVVGSWKDELEVEHVRVHRIEKPAR